ncbi:hypothetical protein FBQ81_03355 [Chloroflexi bacterium CFX6]|nr:hypothetical protein [Chloroflexi bacterium CFX6]
MKRKHQPYRRNDGFWSCSVCKWKFQTRPSKDNCPGILRIERATAEYKTRKQWRKLGFEPIPADELRDTPYDAVSIVHSTDWHGYYHRDHVRRITLRAVDDGQAVDQSGQVAVPVATNA